MFGKIVNVLARLVGETEKVVHEPVIPILHPYMKKVSPQLWRGSWPDKDDLEYLWGQGFQRVINLCAERNQDKLVRQMGMEPSNIKILDGSAPSMWDLEDFLYLIDGENCYVHCEEGVGRTGCMVAAYRVKVEQWSPADALAEANSFGILMPDQREWILKL